MNNSLRPEYQEGQQAYREGKLPGANPYYSKTLENHYWNQGWYAAQQEAQQNKQDSKESR